MHKSVITRPHITEKSMHLANLGKYTFVVTLAANKHQVADEIEKIYKVKPVNVKMIKKQEVSKMFKRRYPGTKKGFKKAIITLNKKDKIKDFVIKEK